MRRSVLLLLPLLAGCASRADRVAPVAPPPIAVAPAAAPELPAGASPGMAVPARLADGSFPTPNRQLTPAATLWHLRAGLNVAALACTGAEGAAITAGYNALLAREKAALAAAEAGYAAEFRAGGGDWRDRYDDSMTRLYNYWSQTPARGGLCAAAGQALAALAGADMSAAATPMLASLDRPFTDFYGAYDAWRTARMAPRLAPLPPTVIATVDAVPALAVPRAPAALAAPPTVAPAPRPTPRPRLELDPSVFGTPESAP